MNVRDTLARCNRLQQEKGFKLFASIAVAVLAIAGMVAYVVSTHSHAAPTITADPTLAPGEEGLNEEAAKILNNILGSKQDPTTVCLGIGIGAGLIITILWLGLGLTYLGLGLGVGAVVLAAKVLPLSPKVPPLLIGIALLAGSFSVLVRLMGMLLSPTGPVFAVARNVLQEAVRMKISMVFIILLMFGLAALPGLLDDKTFLRYRVQTFLQYGTSGSFWLIAVLVLVFSASSVAAEQRDKVIWQTMTKPVAAWQYVLGKWLGVVSLAAVLLGVSASGVFMFTEYLRHQPASGETTAYVARVDNDITEDRFILENEVLTARETKQPDLAKFDEEQFLKNANERVQTELDKYINSGLAQGTDIEKLRETMAATILKDLPAAAQREFRSLVPGQVRTYTFSGLQDATKSQRPLMLRFKISAGGNMPDQLYHLTIAIRTEGGPRYIEAPLNQMLQVKDPPILAGAIDSDGKLEVDFINGRVERLENNSIALTQSNPEELTFPADGLELSYSVGGYRANFLRCMAVLWVKLAFLAMLAICAGTFLSFPVACLVAFTVFLSAEGSRFILESLESYTTETREGHTLYFNTFVSWIAETVARVFTVYADLRPTGRLVEGLRLSWGQVGLGTLVLSGATSILFAIGTFIFRRRELATYSGQ